MESQNVKDTVRQIFIVICIGCSFLLMIGLIMFKRKEFKEEMHKKFHVG